MTPILDLSQSNAKRLAAHILLRSEPWGAEWPFTGFGYEYWLQNLAREPLFSQDCHARGEFRGSFC